MTMKTVAIYLLGVITGGAFVGLWVHSTASVVPSSVPAPEKSSAVEASTKSDRIVSAPNATVAVRAEPGLKGLPTKTGPQAQGQPVEPTSSDSARPTYDFSSVTNSERKLEQIFQAETTDPAWSSQTVDSLNLLLSQMPERAVIGDYGLTCKESLCKLEITGPADQLASARRENNIQPALLRLIGEAPGNSLFDNSMMRVEVEPNNQARITLYAHRRLGK
jgi:hypothetical protein